MAPKKEGKSAEELVMIRLNDDIATFIEQSKRKYGLDSHQLFLHMQKGLKFENQVLVPSSIFTRKLGVLETIVKYLVEEHHLSYKDISVFLNRNQKTIWSTYYKSKKKFPDKLTVSESSPIPLMIFQDRNKSMLEALCLFMRKEYNMSYHNIAMALHRDDRTIWASCHRK